MQKKIKKYFKEIVVWGLVVTIIIVMAFWTYGTQKSDRSEPEFPITINKEGVSHQDIYQFYQGWMQELRTRIPNLNLPENYLKGEAVNRLIREKLMEQKAERIGLVQGEEAVRQFIVHNPIFQKDGEFKKGIYEEWIKERRITPTEYEDDIRDYVHKQLFQQMLFESVKNSTTELRRDYVVSKGSLQYDYVQIDATKMNVNKITKEEVEAWLSQEPNVQKAQQYYEANKKLKYTTLKDSKEVTTPFEEVKFKIAEQTLTEDRLKAEAKTLAELVIGQWSKGQVDNKLLKEKKLSIQTSEKISLPTLYHKDLGYQKDLSLKLFVLKVGEVYPSFIQNQNKFFVLKVKSKPDVDFKDFEKDSDTVDEQLLLSKTQTLMQTYAEWLKKQSEIKIQDGVLNPKDN